jgi:tRNA nucleotidyltransferase (CCA-adding enzyme)
MWYKLAQENIDIPLPNYTYQILSDIQSLGGRTLIVGGAVRDAILGYKPKDIDFEVYGLSYETLQKVLEKYGKTVLEGKAFGVVKFTGKDGSDFDFSLPRTDSKAGVGHKDFSVSTSSDLTPEEAASRRDFTINAISYDPLTKEIIDPYNGREDLKNKILRHTSDSFSDDPLRLLRAMQFGARFGFDLAPETAELARSIKDHYKHLPKERVEAEFKKLVQKGMEPGRALQILYDTGWSENFPEIHNIKDIPQQKEHHPEGNVSTHTMHVMNQAAKIADKNNLTPEERETLIYSALAHDYGKSTHTQLIIDKNGNQKIISPGHEAASGPLAKKFLNSIGVKNKIIDLVVKLVENHMQHLVFENAKYKDAFVVSKRCKSDKFFETKQW